MWIVAVAALCVAGSAVAEDRGGLIGSGTRAEDSGQVLGSGAAAGQTVGSGGRGEANDQFMGSGGRSGDGGQVLGSGSGRDGYLGSGLAIFEFRLFDGMSVLVVSSNEETFIDQDATMS